MKTIGDASMDLIGDVGGTWVRLGLKEKGKLQWKKRKTYPVADYSSLEGVLREFLHAENISIDAACFAVAGPVREKRIRLTNTLWEIDVKSLAKLLKTKRIYILNDLVAHAYGIQLIKKEERFIVYEGSLDKEGNRAVIAVGTGLGEAAMMREGNRYIPFATEGGHRDFAPRNDLEMELFLALRKEFHHVSYERILSGSGIIRLYRFLKETQKEKPDPFIDSLKEEKQPPQILSRGLRKESVICESVSKWFLSIFAAEIGNVALNYYATGGVFLCGQIAIFLSKKMKEQQFLSAYFEKGRMSSLLRTIPLLVIVNEESSLKGAAKYLEQQE